MTFMYALAVMFAISWVWILLYLPETPYYSFRKRRLDEFYATIETMAKTNKVVDFNLDELKA